MQEHIDLTISIVNYNTKDILRNCLVSILNNVKDIAFEIIVLDNNSSDGSVNMIISEFPQVNLIKNSKNDYFAKGHNRIFEKAVGDYICILNSDTIILPNTLEYMLNKIRNSNNIGAIGCKLIDESGNTQNSLFKKISLLNVLSLSRYVSRFIRPFIPNRNYSMDIYLKECYVDVIQDSLIILKRKFIEDNHIYYNKLKLYCTEDQIAKVIECNNLKLFFTPKVSAVHLLSKSTRPDKRALFVYKISRDDNYYYFRKYHGLIPSIIVYTLLSIDILFIMIAEFIKYILGKK